MLVIVEVVFDMVYIFFWKLFEFDFFVNFGGVDEFIVFIFFVGEFIVVLLYSEFLFWVI